LEKHVEIDDRLKFVAAELTWDEGWAEALEDCTYVLHVASPIPRALTKNEDELILPARDGVLRFFAAARARRVLAGWC